MKTITASAAKDLHFLAEDFRRILGSSHDETAERLRLAGAQHARMYRT